MCLIAVAKKGTQKYSDFFLDGIRRASVTNTDGIGYSFKRNNSSKIWIAKGFKDVEKFIKCLKSKRLKDDDELMVHLRIGNKGAKTTDMNHPFVLSNDDDEIIFNDGYVEKSTMCHNGTFHDYSIHNSEKSDTFFFIKRFMAVKEIQDLLKRDTKLFEETFKEILKINRLSFIFNDNSPMATIGTFIEDQDYFFSNVSYKEKDYRNYGGYESYGDDITDDYDSRNSNINNWRDRQESANRMRRIALARNSDSTNEIDFTNLAPAGTRVRDSSGLLHASEKFDIMPIVEESNDHIYDRDTFKRLYPACDRAIFVPLTYISTQREDSKFAPQEFNYNHFLFRCKIGDMSKGLQREKAYSIINFDKLKSKNTPLHCISPILTETDLSLNFVYVTSKELLENFSITIRPSFKDSYNNLYRLLRENNNYSRKLFNSVQGAIISAEGKDKQVTNFKKLKSIDITALKLYQNYMSMSLFTNTDSKYVPYDTLFKPSVRERSVLVN